MLYAGMEAHTRIVGGANRLRVLDTVAHGMVAAGVSEAEAALIPSMALAWAECGFPVIEPGHQLAASLMATSVPRDFTQLHMPWRTFGFIVPPRILQEEPAFGCVMHAHTGRVIMLAETEGRGAGSAMLHYGSESSIAGWGEKLVESTATGEPVLQETAGASRDLRRSELLGRLVLGICLEFDQYKESVTRSSNNSNQRKYGIPVADTFRLTRHVRLDVRPAIRDYVKGARRNSPTVQSLVRGHWKTQACGESASERKLIHIEPYWRGPDESPLAIRSHVLNETRR